MEIRFMDFFNLETFFFLFVGNCFSKYSLVSSWYDLNGSRCLILIFLSTFLKWEKAATVAENDSFMKIINFVKTAKNDGVDITNLSSFVNFNRTVSAINIKMKHEINQNQIESEQIIKSLKIGGGF